MRILITAGGTREYLDPVRFITNASTGRMGFALARQAVKAGHSVTLITAPTSLRPPEKARLVKVQTAQEMQAAVKAHFENCHCLIMAAAVSDYRPEKTSKTKLKKTSTPLTIKLKPTPDILKWAGKNKKTRLIVGFALEDTNLRTRVREKLTKKNLDMIVANRPSVIGKDTASVQILTKTGKWTTIPTAKKTTIAKKIITLIQTLQP